MIFSRFSIDFLPLGNPINIDALRAATPSLLYSLVICCCSKEFRSSGVFVPLCIVRQDGVVERTNHYYPYGGLHGGSIMKFSCFRVFRCSLII